MRMTDGPFRLAAFKWLGEQVERRGDEALPWNLLATGFPHGNKWIHLVGPRGIFKPEVMQLPLSLRSSYQSKYNDTFCSDDLLYYCYMGNDPVHSDNVGLHRAMEERLPLVYFHQLMERGPWFQTRVGGLPEPLVQVAFRPSAASITP